MLHSHIQTLSVEVYLTDTMFDDSKIKKKNLLDINLPSGPLSY